MSGLSNQNSNQNEKLNNILFVLILGLSIITGVLFTLESTFYSGIVYFLLILTIIPTGIIYGFISKNPKKSFALGFLTVLLCLGIATWRPDIITQIIILTASLCLGILNGLAGYFMAKNDSDSKKNTFYKSLSLMFFLANLLTFILINLD
ncbi:hypothetical protein MsAg5_01270 [Methanosarcinaceae archaeon Ag5]|uniref:Uncharacterized protein n=1 Tax=Methanolapillus africanus TaxID=3028297 RepID=A0AAE4MIM1_9EURY|nr:hypothetical protein [Methanosarcinaceae archaeon Ag5]